MDDVIIFLFYLLLLVVTTAIALSAYRGGRKDGYEEGMKYGEISGAVAERERRDAEDLRISRIAARVEERLGKMELDEFTQEELDA